MPGQLFPPFAQKGETAGVYQIFTYMNLRYYKTLLKLTVGTSGFCTSHIKKPIPQQARKTFLGPEGPSPICHTE